MSTTVLSILGAAGLWVLALFAIAHFGERQAPRLQRFWPLIYSLSLAAYCTSWTFYGTVTQAGFWQAWLPPTFVGTIIFLLFASGFLARLAALARTHNAASLADLIASVFGKHSGLAAVITLVAVLGMVPYVALQLKAVATSYALLSGSEASADAWRDAALWVALLMAIFATLFGTRAASATEPNRGLVLALAVESLFKLGVLLFAGFYALWLLPSGSKVAQLAQFVPMRLEAGYLALAGLGALAIFTLPHQFHLTVLELKEPRHLRTARWMFPLYLLLIALPIAPLALSGSLLLGASQPADLYVLGLPLSRQDNGIALLIFLGGMSAATGMVIVTALTLSIMIANHWITPWLVHFSLRRRGALDLRPMVLTLRRLSVMLVMALAYVYSRYVGTGSALAETGSVAMLMLAQLAPALLAAVYRPSLPGRAVLFGIVSGALLVLWLALLPALLEAGLARAAVEALWAPLQPGHFLGSDHWDPVARALTLSLAGNVLVMAITARLKGAPQRATLGAARTLSVLSLAQRFLAPAQVAQLRALSPDSDDASGALILAAERELAGVIGASSARLLLDSARTGRAPALDTVADWLGQSATAVKFNRRLLEAALQNMSQGISVVDRELRLTAWNTRYAELFNYPATLLKVGTPVIELVRFNANRGLLGDGDLGREIARRLGHLAAGTPYVTERHFADGVVIEIRGNPLPDGGFVATFTDVTAFRQAELALKLANETLESKVNQRTQALALATLEAERANSAKSRFLTAISHDLLQPINAAQLFSHGLAQQFEDPHALKSLRGLQGALQSATALLTSLLDISRIDAGRQEANVRAFPLMEVLQPLQVEFAVLALERNVQFKLAPTRLWVRSDPQLLRRILQNFLSNALNHARPKGARALLGVRRAGNELLLGVWDNGPGIAAADRVRIFEEFQRAAPPSEHAPGIGLGLAIAQRLARLLAHPLLLRTTVGEGACFALRVPLAAAHAVPMVRIETPNQALHAAVLVVDNDAASAEALAMLLRGWGLEVRVATNLEQASATERAQAADAWILDYHLDHGATGLDLYAALSAGHGARPTIIVSADHSSELAEQINRHGLALLHKPIKPLRLRTLLRALVDRS